MANAKDVFDLATLTYPGRPSDQAKLLLREVRPLGVVSSSLATLPQALEELLTNPGKWADWVTVKLAVEGFIQNNHIDLADHVGGALSSPLSTTQNGHSALYFVIHDTSAPTLPVGAHFPANIDDASWSGNRLSRYAGAPNPVAHMFVNRAGESATGHDFGTPKFATKFERDRPQIVGRFIHTELIQPRIENAHGIDEFAPTPGFSTVQLVRLALLYVCASVRAKNWLIPAFHCVIDEGIPNGHDDPQHFSLADWGDALNTLRAQIDPQIV